MGSAERREPVTRGTGNVFADLGCSDAAARPARLRLPDSVNRVLEARKLSDANAANHFFTRSGVRSRVSSMTTAGGTTTWPYKGGRTVAGSIRITRPAGVTSA